MTTVFARPARLGAVAPRKQPVWVRENGGGGHWDNDPDEDTQRRFGYRPAPKPAPWSPPVSVSTPPPPPKKPPALPPIILKRAPACGEGGPCPADPPPFVLPRSSGSSSEGPVIPPTPPPPTVAPWPIDPWGRKYPPGHPPVPPTVDELPSMPDPTGKSGNVWSFDPRSAVSSASTVVQSTPYEGTGFAPYAAPTAPGWASPIQEFFRDLSKAIGLGAVADPDPTGIASAWSAGFAKARGATTPYAMHQARVSTYSATPNQVASILSRGQSAIEGSAAAYRSVGSGQSLNLRVQQLPQTPIDWGAGKKKQAASPLTRMLLVAAVVGGGYYAFKKVSKKKGG